MTDSPTNDSSNDAPEPDGDAGREKQWAPSGGPVGFGVDVGGSGVKGGVVDLTTGELIGDRIKILTPDPSTPEAVADTVRRIVEQAGWDGPVGITMPCVVMHGVTRTAANIDKSWIGTDARALYSSALGGRTVTVLNDADAAGIAEDRFGAAKDADGVVVLLTFGTGIGSAVIHDGVLLPNTEFGHLLVAGDKKKGIEAEHWAASSVKDTEELSYKDWAARVTDVLTVYEDLLWPDLFIAGGGVSRKFDKWGPHLGTRTPVVAAQLRNTAGIVGAAFAVTRE